MSCFFACDSTVASQLCLGFEELPLHCALCDCFYLLIIWGEGFPPCVSAQRLMPICVAGAKWHEDLISKFNSFPNCFTLRFVRFMWVLQRKIWSCGHAHLYRGVTLQPLFPWNTLYRCIYICICNCIKPQYPDNIGRYSSQRGLQGALWHFVWARFWAQAYQLTFLEICTGGCTTNYRTPKNKHTKKMMPENEK